MTSFKFYLSAIAVGFCCSFSALQGQEVKPLDVSLAVSCNAPGHVFTELKQPSFTLNATVASPTVTYEIFDWKGKLFDKGTWRVADKLELKNLPKGYYVLKISGMAGEFPFGVVVDPSNRVHNPDSFFAMDTAQSWLAAPKGKNPRQPKDSYAVVSEIAKLAGVTSVRDRMGWGEVTREPSSYAWGRYMVNAKLLSERGIKVSGMFHDAPMRAKTPSSGMLPDDLIELNAFCRIAATTFKGKMNAWEFWNEEDGCFSDEPAWDFAAAMKAAYLGFKEGSPETPVLIGALCVFPYEYDEQLFDNGVGDYMDIFNFHCYKNFNDYQRYCQSFRDLLARHNCPEVPFWITEHGCDYEGAGKIDSFMKIDAFVNGVKEHDRTQELILAEFAPKSQILMQSLGIARDYFFVLPPLNEKQGSKAWGLLRYDYSIKPAYVAFTTLTSQLADAKYLGTMDVAKDVRAFLYEKPDKSQTLVFWSESDLDKPSREKDPEINIKNDFERNFSFPISGSGFFGHGLKSPLKLVDVMGGESTLLPHEGVVALHSTRYPAYLSGFSGCTPTSPAPRIPQVDLARKNAKDLSIVYQIRPGEGFRVGSRFPATLINESGKFTLNVYNFSNEKKTGSIVVSDNFSVEGIPSILELPPYGKVSLECKGVPKLTQDAYKAKITFSGVFNGKSVSPLKFHINVQQALLKGTVVKTFDFMNPAKWRKNASGEMDVSFDKEENAIKFKTKFRPEVDHWVYPEYVLNLPEESLAGAVCVSFEIKAIQKDNAGYTYNFLMAVTDKAKGTRVDFSYLRPSKEWSQVMIPLADIRIAKDWNQVTTPFPDNRNFDPAEVKVLRLGMNPEKDELTYWVRNLKVYYPDNLKN